ncbi:hypothetical protein B0H34DRAFT_686455 [Crassisporium funariophilum]|nr:hypothetical protein B0H34DRAFT_686455 [Crassisporium funariophilum]
MASHSPQRPRRPQTQQLSQGAIPTMPREASPSPSLRDRPRALKAMSMPLVPSIAAFAAQQASQAQQSSPTIPNINNTRRSPPVGQITRLLPTPPHPNPPNFQDMSERRMSPAPPPQQPSNQSNVNSHYARPIPRAPTGPFLNKFQNMEENWQMTAELMADIERADQQQAHYQSAQSHPYPSGARGESPSPARGPNVERVRGSAERSSPNNPDNGQQRRQREQAVARESPKARDRQSNSPIVASYAQAQLQALTPERRMSPAQHSPLVPLSSEPHPSSYHTQYNTRESPPVLRRTGNSETRLNVSTASQTPPLQALPARTPDRSLPVQEEAEDEIAPKNGSASHENWQGKEQIHEQFRSPSPTPSSDLNPEGNAQRYDNSTRGKENASGHRDDDKSIHKREEDPSQYAERSSAEEEGTPRSPTVGLPDDNLAQPYFAQNLPNRVPVPIPMRSKARNGSIDQVMLGMDGALFDKQTPSSLAPPPQQRQPQQQPQVVERPPKYVEQHRLPGETHETQHYQQYSPQQEYGYSHEPQLDSHGRYIPPQVYPDDFQSYGEESTSAYIQSYLQSPRPDAPVPPTPRSATAAPSPSPAVSGWSGGKELPSYRPARAGGSPYPFPFAHVRRNRQAQRYFPGSFDPNHPSVISEQVARQWQVFAQNNRGDVTDSTLSPSSTPFQGELYDHWAYHHTNRMMRGLQDSVSLHSSPSHQPISLPIPSFTMKKKERNLQSKRQAYNRKPPPRVESTQPRETSPELSSSGEETAGEERHSTAPETTLAESTDCEPIQVTILPIENIEMEDSGEWVDEEDDDDYDDLIDLEYHPTFVKNIGKRRRKWEVGWENLIQAFQALDRQTDATMVLLASPSHTTKLHALRSRSIRRHALLANSASMSELRGSFARMAFQRKATHSEKSSLVDRLLINSNSSGEGSDGSSASVEGNLRRALDAALSSLGVMGEVYEQREARVLEELQRSRDDRERVALLLKQVLGENHPLSNSSPRPTPS